MKKPKDIEALILFKIREHKAIELAKSHYFRLLKEIEEENSKVHTFKRMIRGALDNISDLEKMNMRSIFKKLIGQHDDALEIYRQEYLRNTLDYNEALKSIKILEYEKGILEEKIRNEIDVKKELQKLFLIRSKKFKFLPLNEIKNLFDQIDNKNKLLKEIEEALSVSTQLLRILNTTTKSIEFAIAKGDQLNIEIEDLLENKIFNIDRFQDYIVQMKQKLIEFESELDDIYMEADISDFPHFQYSDNFSKISREFIINICQNYNAVTHIIYFFDNYKLTIKNVQKTLRSDRDRLKREIKKLLKEKKKKLQQTLL